MHMDLSASLSFDMLTHILHAHVYDKCVWAHPSTHVCRTESMLQGTKTNIIMKCIWAHFLTPVCHMSLSVSRPCVCVCVCVCVAHVAHVLTPVYGESIRACLLTHISAHVFVFVP